MERIILASGSPRRRQLLEWAEVEFSVIVKETDENYPSGLPVNEIPIFVARNKAHEVRKSDTFKRYGDGTTILAADTMVVLDEMIIGKPIHREEAKRILNLLSGKEHLVITGVVVLKGEKEISFSDITRVTFHELTDDQIEFYVDKYKPYDKAGAYAIQEWIGVIGIKCINGDFYNVMGLPVSKVVKTLEKIANQH